MEQSLSEFDIVSNTIKGKLRCLDPFNRLFYICNLAGKESNDTVSYESFILASEATELIYFIRETYSLNDYQEIIENQRTLINRNDELLTASPIVMGIETWKEIITYELSLISLPDRTKEVKKFIGCLKDLIYRIDNKSIFNVIDELLFEDLFSNYSNSEMESEWSVIQPATEADFMDSYQFPEEEFVDENGRAFIDLLSKENFVIPIRTYIKYIESIDLNSLKIENSNTFLKRLEELENRIKRKKTNKITLIKKVKPVIKGLTYLLSKNNKNIDHDSLSGFSTNFIYSIFDSGESHSWRSPNKIEFPNELLVDYLIFLEKYGYFQNDSSISIPKILEQQIWYDMKGKSKQTFYRLFKLKLPNPEKIHETKIYFCGLTSEIALKNEMINEN